MKNLSLAGLIGATLLLSAFTINSPINWKIEEGYAIQFKGTDVEGVFKKIDGEISFGENDLANSTMSISIDVSSISTGNGMKNRHARSAKWFDAETFPKIKFDSKKFAKTETGYSVTGTLDMHGVQKEVSIPFTFASNTFTASFSVNRLDYGIGTMKGMSKKVSNEIELQISVPVSSTNSK